MELAAVSAALAERRPLAILGEAGIGKTTLARSAIGASDRRAFEAGGLATLSWMPRFALARALGRTELPGDLEHAAQLVEDSIGDGALLFDDVQWADAQSRKALGLLSGRVALLAAVRRDDPAAEEAIRQLADDGFELLELPPLGDEAASTLVRQLRPELTDSAVARLVQSARGNPLVLGELATHGEASESFRLALAARLRGLSGAGRETLGLLCLAGRPLPSDQVEGGGCTELLERGFAVGQGGAVSVRHALIGEVLAQLLEPTERVRLHSWLARLVDGPGEAARHHAAAGEREQAHAKALEAAGSAETAGAAAAHLGLAAETAIGSHADVLRLQAIRALSDAGDAERVMRLLDAVTEEDPETRALVCVYRSRASWWLNDPAAAREHIESGFRLVGGSGSEAEALLMAERARYTLLVEHDYAAAADAAKEALALAGEQGFGAGMALAYLGTAQAELGLGDWRGHLEAAVAQLRETGERSGEFVASYNLVRAECASGDPLRAWELAEDAIARMQSLGLTARARQLSLLALSIDSQLGRFDHVISRGQDLIDELVDPRSRESLASTYAMALVDTGGFREAGNLMRRLEPSVTQDVWGAGLLLYARAEHELWSGRPKAAAAAAADFAQRFGGRYPYADETTAVVASWAALALGTEPPEPPPPSGLDLGAALQAELAGLCSLAAGDAASAADAFRSGAACAAGHSLRDELRCSYGEGEALRRSGRRDDAVDVLEAVEARAQEHGMTPLLSWIRRSLRAGGGRRSADRVRDGLLTGRERELLALVREGLSNAEIARRLGLARRTVETQLASAQRKLGAASRLQAALLDAE
jgi:DNA-binding CsgD family transcriptional regulator